MKERKEAEVNLEKEEGIGGEMIDFDTIPAKGLKVR